MNDPRPTPKSAHLSLPAILTISYVAGIALGKYAEWPPVIVAVFLLIGLGVWVESRHKQMQEIVLYFLLGFVLFCVGSWNLEMAISPSSRSVQLWAGLKKSVWVEGRVATDVAMEPKWGRMLKTFSFRVSQIWVGEEPFPTSGSLKVYIPPWVGPIEEGDRARFLGRIVLKQARSVLWVDAKDPQWTILRKEGNPVWLGMLRFRQRLRRQVESDLPPTEASLLEALLLGWRTDLPEGLKTAFMRTGTFHIVSISGLHVALLASLIYLILKLFQMPRPIRLVVSAVVIAAYAVWVGPVPSVSRSAIMIDAVLLSKLFQRPSDPVHALFLAAFAILWIDPQALWQAGFQLSFICVWAIFKISPRFSWLPSPIAISLSTWLASAPLIAFHFKIFSLITVVANLIIVPLSSFCLSAGVAFLFLGNLFPALSRLLAGGVQALFAALIWAVWGLAQVPAGWIEVTQPSAWILGAYYLLFLLWACLPAPGGVDSRRSPLIN